MSFVKSKYTCLILSILWSSFFIRAQKELKELYSKTNEQFKKGNYDDALISSIKALKIAESTKDCPQTAYALLQVGKMHYFNHDRRRGIVYFFKTLSVVDSCHVDSLRHLVYNNIGAMYTELGIIDSAFIYLKKCKEILEPTNDYGNLSKINAVIADMYLWNMNDLPEAEKYIVKAEEFAELSKEKRWLAFALMKRGMLNQQRKKYPEALAAYKKALKYNEELGSVEGRMYAMRLMLDVMSLSGNPETNAFISRYILLKDSIFGNESAQKIAQYQTLYETEKKENENKLLIQKDELNKKEIETKNRTIIGLLIGVLLIVITIFWRVSVINLKKKNLELQAAQALQKEKERISRDLHDNVGGQLSYVLYSLDGIENEDKKARVELSKNIGEAVRGVISNLRETIWAISDETIAINDFSDKLKVYARTIFKNTTTKIIFNEQIETNVELNSLVGLNLYRICQEIINNAFKHSKATELRVDIISKEKTTVIVSDNGEGFELKKQNEEGFGLSNIKSRAKEVGIELDLKTELNKGVVYTLVV